MKLNEPAPHPEGEKGGEILVMGERAPMPPARRAALPGREDCPYGLVVPLPRWERGLGITVKVPREKEPYLPGEGLRGFFPIIPRRNDSR